MKSKTDDIEFAIRFTLPSEPISLDEAKELLFRGHPTLRDEDPRWIWVAFANAESAGRVRFPDCDHDSHEGDCKVELAR